MNRISLVVVFLVFVQVQALDIVQLLKKRSVVFETTVIPNVLLPGQRYGSFYLQPYQVWTDTFKYLAPQPDGSLLEIPVRPSKRYFKGTIDNNYDQTVVVSLSEQGEVGGVALYNEKTFVLALKDNVERGERTLSLEEPQDDMEVWKDKSWCGSNHEEHTAPYAPDLSNVTQGHHHVERQTITNVIRVAVECDSTYWARWNNYQTAADYTTDIFTVTSGIYERDAYAQLRLDTFMCSASAYSYGTNTGTALSGFLSRWNANFGSITRDIATLLLGANVGGLAYLSAACGSYAYGVCGMTFGAPNGIFDYVLVAHEIGHNVGTGHTHCYSPPVDNCYASESGCYTGAVSVPSGGGSIMSYCHVRPGGVSNLRLSFGAPGLYGTQSERVPARIRTYIAGATRANCLPPYTAGTGSVTTGRITSGRVTTGSIPVTTGRSITTQAVTTRAVTTQAVTTRAVTTQAVTTQAVTTDSVTTQSVTSSQITSGTPPIVDPEESNVEGEGILGNKNFIYGVAGAGGGLLILSVVAVVVGIAVRKQKKKKEQELYNPSSNINMTPIGLSVVPNNSPPSNSEYHRPQSSPRGVSPQVHSGYNRPIIPPAQGHAPPSKPLPSSPSSIPKGTKVMATFTGDGKPYQAVVVDFQNGKYKVSYPDYNNDTEWLPPSAVKKL